MFGLFEELVKEADPLNCSLFFVNILVSKCCLSESCLAVEKSSDEVLGLVQGSIRHVKRFHWKQWIVLNKFRQVMLWPTTTIKLQALGRLQLAIWLKNRLWHRCFHVSFAKFLRILFLTEHRATTSVLRSFQCYSIFKDDNYSHVNKNQEQ